MNRDDIIELVREADIDWHQRWVIGEDENRLERFARLVAAAEREECAKVCDVTPPYPFRPSIEAAHAIRAREENQ